MADGDIRLRVQGYSVEFGLRSVAVGENGRAIVASHRIELTTVPDRAGQVIHAALDFFDGAPPRAIEVGTYVVTERRARLSAPASEFDRAFRVLRDGAAVDLVINPANVVDGTPGVQRITSMSLIMSRGGE